MSQIFNYIAIPFGYLMRFCIYISPGHNYVVALIFFTVIIQALLCLLFGIKQQKNMLKQASMAPRAAAIRKKYAGRTDNATRLKMQEEIQALYQENGYSPAAGCLPLLMQLPIIFSLYYVITEPLNYICMLTKTEVTNLITSFKSIGTVFSETALKSLENAKAIGADGNYVMNYTRQAQTEIINQINEWKAAGDFASIEKYAPALKDALLPKYKLGILDFSVTPPYPNANNFLENYNWLLLLVPVLIVATMIFSTMITRKFTYQDPTVQEQQNSCSMKVMLYTTPLFSAFISFSLPAAVGLYWIYRTLAATAQQIILTKLMPPPKFTEEDYKAAEREVLGTSNKKKKKMEKEARSAGQNPSGPKKRSLHHIDDDDDDESVKNAEPDNKDDKDKAEGNEDSDAEISADTADMPKLKDDKGTTRYEKKKK